MNQNYLATLSLEELIELSFNINSLIVSRKNADKIERLKNIQSDTNISSNKKLYGRCHYLVKKNNEGTISDKDLEELRHLAPLYSTCKWMINAKPIPSLIQG